jgi:flagellum-specific peptidoglycan hydrolase FlgJ
MRKLRLIILSLFIFSSCSFLKAQTIDSIFNYICESGVHYPEVVMRQVILETGWLKNKYLMQKNNLFAFRHRKAYMEFDTWQESIDYYRGWQDRHFKHQEEDYYAFLLRIKYASSPRYVQTLKKIKIPR